MSQKEKLVWHNERRKLSALTPYDHNPRSMPEAMMSQLMDSLAMRNVVEPFVINTDGRLIAGHQRKSALERLNRADELVDCRVPSRPLTEKEYKQYLLVSNRVHADWRYETLAEYFDIETMLVSGFDDTDLSAIFADALEVEDDGFDVDAELKKIGEPKARMGDLYALGPHRLCCGDSLDPATVKKLVGGAKIDMVYCDPIYNISLDYNAGVGGKASYGGTVQDRKSDDEYRAFLKQSMENALSVAKPDAHFYYWCDEKNIGTVQALFTELGLENRRVCLWLKPSANPVPGVAFNKCYEPVVYATRGKPYLSPVSLNFAEVLNKELGPSGNKLLADFMDLIDVWIAKRVPTNELSHATQKPLDLHERPIKRCTRPGDAILDLFGGSGSTLLSADAMKRVCYTAEIESIFVDLIIARYEKNTNTKAKKLN